MLLVTAKQMQEMDRQTIESFGIPGLVLMENAGRGAFDFLFKKFKGIKKQKVAVLAGRGNNGGDGFVIARYLMEKGVAVTCFLFSSKDKVKGDAKVNLDLAQKLCDLSRCNQYKTSEIVEIPNTDAFKKYKTSIVHHDFFIDAILGTGLNSNVRGFFKDIIELINSLAQPVFSIDIPSGLNSDTGQPLGIAVKADATATFAFAKRGHILYPGNIYTGDLKVIDIGIPQFITKKSNIKLSLMKKKKIAALFNPRQFQSHKGSYGHLLVIAGSAGKTGAAGLCSNAAMRSGTGLVTLGIAKSLNKIIEPMVIEPMTSLLPEKERGYLSDNCFDNIKLLLKGKQALALGPGIGTKKSTKQLINKLIEASEVPLILDADALNCIAQKPEILKIKKAPAILTPHPGEMARLCNMKTSYIQNNRLETALDFAEQYNVILILKGAQTIVCFPDGQSHICPTGNPGMASGGMGDILTGIIAGFCAQGFSPESASLAGVYIHGLCADILADDMGKFGFLATDMVRIIPKAIHKYLLR
jgi:ADP-dependent NAD(P)H-hydrate dehydratase / NAD(P)H-hydrate epimerase